LSLIHGIVVVTCYW